METKTIGRPSDYSIELATVICDLIASGLSMVKVCEMDGMPARRTIFLWLAKDEDFMRMYARATTARADAMFEEMFEIADDGTNDMRVREDGTEYVDHDHIQRSKLRIDTRKWALARMNPRKFGEKVTTEITGPEGGPVRSAIDITMQAKQAADAWQALKDADGE